MKNKLEVAVNSICGVHPEWGKLQCFRIGFKEGARWQKENMWTRVKEELPDIDKLCFVLTKNEKTCVSSMYTPKDCYGNILGDKQWHGSASFRESVIAWMYQPVFKHLDK